MKNRHRSRDAILRSAMNVIVVYLYNEMGWVKYRGQNMYVDKEDFQKNAPNAYMAEEADQPMADYLETTVEEVRTMSGESLSAASIVVAPVSPPAGFVMAGAALALNPSWSNFIAMIVGPLGKGAGLVDDAVYFGQPVLKQTVDNVGTINDAVYIGCKVADCE